MQIFYKGRIYPALFLMVLIAACSGKEEKFELYSAEAFIYSMEEGWELNASCSVKGFTQNRTGEEYSAKLSYTADLITPDGKKLESVGEGLIDQKSKEKLSDLLIETQLQIDSSYKPGKYKIAFNVTDDLTGKKISIEKEFEISTE
ncbi:MAG: hypothetical protein KGZ42_11420 [Melioribacter sp.]|nr:hypothetical protein [Melioribacter sp.]